MCCQGNLLVRMFDCLFKSGVYWKYCGLRKKVVLFSGEFYFANRVPKQSSAPYSESPCSFVNALETDSVSGEKVINFMQHVPRMSGYK